MFLNVFWCAEIPLHECNSSVVSALHRCQMYSIPEELVPSHWYQCLLFFQIFTLSIQRSSNQAHFKDILDPAVTLLSSGKGVIIPMSVWAEYAADFKIKHFGSRLAHTKSLLKPHMLHIRVTISIRIFVCWVFLIKRKIIAYNDANHFAVKREKSKL